MRFKGIYYTVLTGLNIILPHPGLRSSLRDFASTWAMRSRLYEPNAKWPNSSVPSEHNLAAPQPNIGGNLTLYTSEIKNRFLSIHLIILSFNDFFYSF